MLFLALPFVYGDVYECRMAGEPRGSVFVLEVVVGLLVVSFL
jgi:hypothetical protein